MSQIVQMKENISIIMNEYIGPEWSYSKHQQAMSMSESRTGIHAGLCRRELLLVRQTLSSRKHWKAENVLSLFFDHEGSFWEETYMWALSVPTHLIPANFIYKLKNKLDINIL